MNVPEDLSTQGVEGALKDIRRAAEAQLGVDPLRTPSTPVRFSADLPDELDDGRWAELQARAERLAPWAQGPFPLGGDLVIGSAGPDERRWIALGPAVGDLSGRRVLDVGSKAGYDPFMFNLRGAAEVIACEPLVQHDQALLLESIYRTGVDLRNVGWQELSVDDIGRFDLVHCDGTVNHEPNPMAMLTRLRELTADGGKLMLGATVLADPELSEHARFVPGSYEGDDTWWWVPGLLALRWMVAAAGFDVVDALDVSDVPAGALMTVSRYLELQRSEREPAGT